MKFLETITNLGNDVLVPIDRIKYINLSYVNGWRIIITSDDGDWEECFDNSISDASERYRKIKEIIEAA